MNGGPTEDLYVSLSKDLTFLQEQHVSNGRFLNVIIISYCVRNGEEQQLTLFIGERSNELFARDPTNNG
jgi:peroxiredoxin